VRRVLALSSLLLLVLAAPASADFTPTQKATMREAMEAEMQQAGYPGIVAGLWVPGRGNFVGATGLARLRDRRPMRVGDTFRIGSVTKTFTATVILRLVEQGKLRLRDRLARYVKGIPAGRQITIRELLNHTSGIPDTSNAITKGVYRDPTHRWHPLRVIRNAVHQKRYCHPGACWHYSNTNYQLLGLIAQRVTGQPIARLYQRAGIRQLHLRHTSFEPGPTVPRPRADGYDRETPGGPLVDTTGWDFYWSWTAGSMTSTLDDLKRYAPALATGRGLLRPRTQRERLDVVPTGTPGIEYGLGIMQYGELLGHDGAVPGYDSLVLYAPATKATFVLLGNTATELNAFKTGPPPSTLFNLANCLAEIAIDQPCS
jgi:D-alanyl-D-alanine carboxypeptidase